MANPFMRDRRGRCDLEVVPFGDAVLYRLLEVAAERPQAVEERWAKGVWLGHARASSTSLAAAEAGVVKAWSVRRLPEGEQWDGEFQKRIRISQGLEDGCQR